MTKSIFSITIQLSLLTEEHIFSYLWSNKYVCTAANFTAQNTDRGVCYRFNSDPGNPLYASIAGEI